MGIKWTLLATALLTLMPITVAVANNDFYQNKAEGWFWYEVEPEEVEEKEPELTAPPAPAPQPLKMPEPSEMKAPPPAAFSSAWIRENLPKYLDLAQTSPTRENVELYLYMQKLAIDNATNFQEMASLLTAGDPYLDENTRSAQSEGLIGLQKKKAEANAQQVITELANRVGFFFFFSGQNCDFCEDQAQILEYLEGLHGITVMPISIDHQPLANGLYPSYRLDDGHAEKMAVMALPAVFMVTPQGQYYPVSQGPISVNQAHQRIIQVAYRERLITDTEYYSTQPAINHQFNVSSKLREANLEHLMDTEGFIAPDKLMPALRDALYGDNQ